MKKYIQYRKEDKRIISISDGLNQGSFEQKEVNLTSKVLNKITSGFYNSYFKRGKIVVEKNDRLLNLEEKQNKQIIINKIKSGKYTPQELGNLLEKIINR